MNRIIENILLLLGYLVVLFIISEIVRRLLSNGKKIKYLFGGRDLLLRSGIFCVRSSATGNKNNETSVTKVIS